MISGAAGKPPGEGELRATLDLPLPAPLPIGLGTAFIVCGCCWHPRAPIERLRLRLGDQSVAPLAFAMPRPDRLEASGEQNAYRSGFWALIPVVSRSDAATVELGVEATLAGGRAARVTLGTIKLEPDLPGKRPVGQAPPQPDLIAICMATYEPPIELFRRQIESIRAQTHERWSCVISDDGSSPPARTAIRDVLAGDRRFELIENERRLGFFHNFERALRAAPAGAAFVALADQDDYWYPEKLAVLREAIGERAAIAYSDASIVDREGRVRSQTYWSERPNQWTDLISLLLANTVSGGAALYRRELIEFALPFPPAFGRFFHDHWLAIAGLACGEIAYVDRPLYDYVQHGVALLGHERATVWARRSRRRREKVLLGFRDPHFYWEHWRTTYFTERCRAALLARVLLLRTGSSIDPDARRALELLAGPDGARLAAWLTRRRLPRIAGTDETLGAEGRLLRALGWRRAVGRGPRGAAHGFVPGTAAPPSAANRERPDV